MANAQLLESLRKLRQRVVAVASASGVGWGLTAALGVLTVGVWLDLVWELPGGARAGCSTLAAAAVIALALAASWMSLRHVEPVAMAHRLDQVARTRGQILAGVDLLGQTAAL